MDRNMWPGYTVIKLPRMGIVLTRPCSVVSSTFNIQIVRQVGKEVPCRISDIRYRITDNGQ